MSLLPDLYRYHDEHTVCALAECFAFGSLVKLCLGSSWYQTKEKQQLLLSPSVPVVVSETTESTDRVPEKKTPDKLSQHITTTTCSQQGTDCSCSSSSVSEQPLIREDDASDDSSDDYFSSETPPQHYAAETDQTSVATPVYQSSHGAFSSVCCSPHHGGEQPITTGTLAPSPNCVSVDWQSLEPKHAMPRWPCLEEQQQSSALGDSQQPHPHVVRCSYDHDQDGVGAFAQQQEQQRNMQNGEVKTRSQHELASDDKQLCAVCQEDTSVTSASSSTATTELLNDAPCCDRNVLRNAWRAFPLKDEATGRALLFPHALGQETKRIRTRIEKLRSSRPNTPKRGGGQQQPAVATTVDAPLYFV